MYSLEYWDDTPRNVKDRKKDLYGLITHGTGSTKPEEAMRATSNPNHAVCEYYDKPKANFPNYLVTWEAQNDEGTGWVQMLAKRHGDKAFLPPDQSVTDPDVYAISATDADQAWTSGTGEAWNALYRQGFNVWARYISNQDREPVDTGTIQAKYRWWQDTWGQTGQNPATLIPGSNDNANTISCELTVPIKPVQRKRSWGWERIPFTARQHDITAWLWAGKFWVYNLPVAEVRQRIVGHEDVHPISRGRYDPGRGKWFDWDLFFQRFQHWYDVIKANTDAYYEPAHGLAAHD